MKFFKLLPAVVLFATSSGSFAQTPEVKQTQTEEVIFERVETEASFPGGLQAWKRYLEKNLKGSVPADNGAPVGHYTVMARFVVNQDGSLSDVIGETKLGYGMEQEVVRILKASGKWEPALQDGHAVKAYRRQPVTFVIMDDDFDAFTKDGYVLTAGTSNEVTIDAGKIKSEDLSVTVTKGTVKPAAGGKFIVTVKAAAGERVILRVYNAKKNNKEVGAVSFEVK